MNTAIAFSEAVDDACCIDERTLVLNHPFELESGEKLNRVSVSMRMLGPPRAPVILVMGGISADGCPVSSEEESREGWWQNLLGPQGLNLAARYRVLSFDWLGGSGGTTGPSGWGTDPERFPAINTRDQANLVGRMLARLGIERLEAVVAASYGGMVAMHLATAEPDSIGRVLVMGSGHRPEPMASARRLAQRKILELGDAPEVVAAARALAMTTYRSPSEFRQRFQGKEGLSELRAYLDHHGRKFSRRFDREAYLRLLDSIDQHGVDPRRIVTPLHLVAFHGDEVSPPALMREIADLSPATRRFITLDTIYGHDAFLCEAARLAPFVQSFLEGERQ